MTPVLACLMEAMKASYRYMQSSYPHSYPVADSNSKANVRIIATLCIILYERMMCVYTCVCVCAYVCCVCVCAYVYMCVYACVYV